MKKLCIDIGNSNVKFGIFNNEEFIYANKISSNEFTYQDLKNILKKENLDFDKIFICSVANSVLNKFLIEFERIDKSIKINPVIVKSDFDFGFNIDYDLSQIGIDRVIAVYGVKKIIKQDKFLLIDCGTAVTIDLFLENTMKGGIIYPGINLMLNSLSIGTEALPKIELANNIEILGKNTKHAISSGVYYGFINLIDFYIKFFKQTYSDIFIFGTGSGCALIKNKFKFDMIDEDIILKGLSKIE